MKRWEGGKCREGGLVSGLEGLGKSGGRRVPRPEGTVLPAEGPDVHGELWVVTARPSPLAPPIWLTSVVAEETT